MGDPSPEAWNRVRRYASWMRQVSVDEWSDVAEDTFRKLHLSSPHGGWFPALQDLSLRITEPNVPYADLLFSPHLKTISIYVPWSQIHPEVSRDDLAAVASNISALPTSTLQFLSVRIGCSTHLVYFKDSLSSVVLRCGPSLTELTSQIPLSDAAVNHLIRLPHLHTLCIENPPPDYSTSPLPLVFPPLTGFTIGGAAARGWISLFERLEGGAFAVRTTAPLSRVKNSLKSLIVYDLVIDISFTSSVQIFRNLVNLCVGVNCNIQDRSRCTFGLNNDDVSRLSMALPQLQDLFLGSPCLKNTCTTTVTCLLSISVHCIELRRLGIHFNTTNIIDDFEKVSEDPRLRELHPLPRCILPHLSVGQMPLTLDGPGFEVVVNGLIDIFPSLEDCGRDGGWGKASGRIAKLRRA